MLATMGVARKHRILIAVVGFFSMVTLLMIAHTNLASAACAAPSTDYGNVSSLPVTISSTGVYRIWTRMVAPDTTNDSYLLEVDGGTCYTVGGTGVATYTSAQASASTYFSTDPNNTTDWVSTTSAGAHIDVTLSAGNHTLKMIGNAPNVVVDRVVLTQDTSCVPHGLGNDCANPPDTTDPVANITSPVNNASVSGTVTVAATATDDSGVVSKLELYVDGSTTATQTDTSSPYSFSVAGLSVGSHTFKVVAYDPTGNSSPSGIITVKVLDSAAPTGVAITAPGAGSSQSGVFNASSTATDNVAVSKVEFYLDGALKTTDTTGPSPFTGSIDVTSVTPGAHSLTAKAYDAAGNATTSAAVSVTVTAVTPNDTTPPTISITAPPSGATLSNDLNNTHFNSAAYAIVAVASDASGIKQVAFKVDGVAVGTPDAATPYSTTLDLTKLSCGSHTITATATDNSTNANTATATTTFTSTLSADITSSPDCHVTYLDLSALAGQYNKTGAPGFTRADINQDGIVNYLDLSGLASKYGK
jgi:hypothetical protein